MLFSCLNVYQGIHRQARTYMANIVCYTLSKYLCIPVCGLVCYTQCNKHFYRLNLILECQAPFDKTVYDGLYVIEFHAHKKFAYKIHICGIDVSQFYMRKQKEIIDNYTLSSK